jgi:hypothetical protein
MSIPSFKITKEHQLISERFLTEDKQKTARNLSDMFKRAAHNIKNSAQEEMQVAKSFSITDWLYILAPTIGEFAGAAAYGILTGILKGLVSSGKGGGRSGGGGGGSSF